VALRAYPRPADDDTPRAMPMSEAAREWAKITNTRRPHRATLIRWCTKGCRGVRLCARRAGGAWFVTRDALVEFHRRTNEHAFAMSPAIGANPARAGEIAAALRELDRLIGGPAA
jgi:hypothetical protein